MMHKFSATAAATIPATAEPARMRRAWLFGNPLLQAGGTEDHRSVARTILLVICGDFPCSVLIHFRVYAPKTYTNPSLFPEPSIISSIGARASR